MRVSSSYIKLLLRILETMCTTEKKKKKKKCTFPLFTMTQCNTATLTIEPISIVQIALSFFFDWYDISDKIMFLQELSNIKMSNRLNEHSYLLIVKKWKLPRSYVSSQLVHDKFCVQFWE